MKTYKLNKIYTDSPNSDIAGFEIRVMKRVLKYFWITVKYFKNSNEAIQYIERNKK